ncbi:bifunctional methylenetetrahydrofolate dehydrogenase/methenyltetrahydrofolate cyclohydrolase FolD [bacterium]|nr:bifunctional methylenetetrahydrofolate dehydrogenase/methenyltetrahydrofolate cyclohydrolase FolD [bacterium]
MQILDGRPVRDAVLAELTGRVAAAPRPPGLAVILVGDDPASRVYVRQKEKACSKVGYHHVTHRLPADTPESELLARIARLNADDEIDGILVQMPLPGHLDEERALMAVDPQKDVDGFHPENLGHLVSGRPRTVACTPRGVLRLLAHHGIEVAGRRVAVVGRSVIVGRPMALLLNLKDAMGDATVVMCHSRTPDLAAETRRADVVIAALGRPEVLTREHVAAGAVVVDVGINRIDDPAAKKGYRLVGDVDSAAMQGHAAALTPVPGGVGPMTIAMLLENTWEAMVRREGSR